MSLSRRRLLVVSAGAALVVPASAALDRLLSALRAAAPGLRPTGAGTTAIRCAQCGADDHAMLDPRCPLAPRIG